MTLYDDLLAAGVPLASHGSDLYAKVTDDSRRMVEGYEFRDQVRIFKNAEDGQPWYDIPFAFSPFWDGIETPFPDVGIKSACRCSSDEVHRLNWVAGDCRNLRGAPDAPRCCYVGGLLGLHALECPQHRPETCPTCQGENQL